MHDILFLTLGIGLGSIIICLTFNCQKKATRTWHPPNNGSEMRLWKMRHVMPKPTSMLPTSINSSKIRMEMDIIRDRFKIPGVVLSISNNVMNQDLALGTYYRPDMLPVNQVNTEMHTNVYFRIGSVTKSMTATCVILLVEKGLLHLEDKLGKWFPEAPNANKISILQMLNMTSGLADYETDKLFNGIFDKDPEILFNPYDLVRYAAEYGKSNPESVAEPGTRWKYCNTGYIYLGLILEMTAKTRLFYVFKELLFDPLGMNDTHLAINANLPTPHAQGFGNERDKLENVTGWSPMWAWAAGGVISNLVDLKKWAHNLGNNTLLSHVRQPVAKLSLVNGASEQLNQNFSSNFFLWTWFIV